MLRHAYGRGRRFAQQVRNHGVAPVLSEELRERGDGALQAFGLGAGVAEAGLRLVVLDDLQGQPQAVLGAAAGYAPGQLLDLTTALSQSVVRPRKTRGEAAPHDDLSLTTRESRSFCVRG
ncbi:hypothetical protein ACIPWL_31770 [Streptomyces sp. NPDC090023]|uniref:hypothetical protein n=1 Tax=unclassified Streptomyces TaxID=2593676 RepID=UPI00381266EA